MVAEADRDAAALLAARRLDHDRAVLLEERRAGRASASICSGTLTPAALTTRRVTALSSQIDMATPVVSSDRLSRQWTERPP